MSAQTVNGHKAATATHIDSPARAEALAQHLLDPARSKPSVVITTAAGQSRPYIDVDEIIEAVSELADVYVLPTGSITFAMSDRLPEKTQVYGGAGRVYPVDSSWQANPYAAPLRFAFDPGQGTGATDNLIADALGAAHSAGLDKKRVGATVKQVEGEVRGLFAPSRAWVRTDDGGDAAIWLELLLHGSSLDRVLQVGMRIRGALDVEERRIDVSASLRKPGDALAGYEVGSVVLGRVVGLDDIAARVELYPGACTGLSANEVTGNPLDRLTTLMSVGEVLPVRVIARGGHNGQGWRLSTLDVEDSEAILPSPSLLPDGPPWLVRAESGPDLAPVPPGTERVEQTGRLEPSRVDAPPASPEQPRAWSPPEMATGPIPPASAGTEPLLRKIARLEGQLMESSASLKAFQTERDEFREQAGEAYARGQQLDQALRKARTDLRLEKKNAQLLEKRVRSAKAEVNRRSDTEVLFSDPEAQFTFEVDVAYAYRISSHDKEIRPRRTVSIGPGFISSLSSTEGVDRGKVVAVTVEIITDLVKEIEGRALHPLRVGEGAAARDVVRSSDGARCMRVALQRNAASARRLHYWKVGDAIELSRVVRHDDMTP